MIVILEKNYPMNMIHIFDILSNDKDYRTIVMNKLAKNTKTWIFVSFYRNYNLHTPVDNFGLKKTPIPDNLDFLEPCSGPGNYSTWPRLRCAMR